MKLIKLVVLVLGIFFLHGLPSLVQTKRIPSTHLNFLQSVTRRDPVNPRTFRREGVLKDEFGRSEIFLNATFKETFYSLDDVKEIVRVSCGDSQLRMSFVGDCPNEAIKAGNIIHVPSRWNCSSGPEPEDQYFSVVSSQVFGTMAFLNVTDATMEDCFEYFDISTDFDFLDASPETYRGFEQIRAEAYEATKPKYSPFLLPKEPILNQGQSYTISWDIYNIDEKEKVNLFYSDQDHPLAVNLPGEGTYEHTIPPPHGDKHKVVYTLKRDCKEENEHWICDEAKTFESKEYWVPEFELKWKEPAEDRVLHYKDDLEGLFLTKGVAPDKIFEIQICSSDATEISCSKIGQFTGSVLVPSPAEGFETGVFWLRAPFEQFSKDSQKFFIQKAIIESPLPLSVHAGAVQVNFTRDREVAVTRVDVEAKGDSIFGPPEQELCTDKYKDAVCFINQKIMSDNEYKVSITLNLSPSYDAYRATFYDNNDLVMRTPLFFVMKATPSFTEPSINSYTYNSVVTAKWTIDMEGPKVSSGSLSYCYSDLYYSTETCSLIFNGVESREYKHTIVEPVQKRMATWGWFELKIGHYVVLSNEFPVGNFVVETSVTSPKVNEYLEVTWDLKGQNQDSKLDITFQLCTFQFQRAVKCRVFAQGAAHPKANKQKDPPTKPSIRGVIYENDANGSDMVIFAYTNEGVEALSVPFSLVFDLDEISMNEAIVARDLNTYCVGDTQSALCTEGCKIKHRNDTMAVKTDGISIDYTMSKTRAMFIGYTRFMTIEAKISFRYGASLVFDEVVNQEHKEILLEKTSDKGSVSFAVPVGAIPIKFGASFRLGSFIQWGIKSTASAMANLTYLREYTVSVDKTLTPKFHSTGDTYPMVNVTADGNFDGYFELGFPLDATFSIQGISSVKVSSTLSAKINLSASTKIKDAWGQDGNALVVSELCKKEHFVQSEVLFLFSRVQILVKFMKFVVLKKSLSGGEQAVGRFCFIPTNEDTKYYVSIGPISQTRSSHCQAGELGGDTVRFLFAEDATDAVANYSSRLYKPKVLVEEAAQESSSGKPKPVFVAKIYYVGKKNGDDFCKQLRNPDSEVSKKWNEGRISSGYPLADHTNCTILESDKENNAAESKNEGTKLTPNYIVLSVVLGIMAILNLFFI